MDRTTPPPIAPASGGHRSLFSKIPFIRSNAANHETHSRQQEGRIHDGPSPSPIPIALQQQKTRRRRGSLRKVALLGRGAQRERRNVIESAATGGGGGGPESAASLLSDAAPQSQQQQQQQHQHQHQRQRQHQHQQQQRQHQHQQKLASPPSPLSTAPPSSEATPAASPEMPAAAWQSSRLSMESSSSGSSVKPSSPSAAAWASLPPIDIPTNARAIEDSSPVAASYSTTDDEDAMHIRPRSMTKPSLLRPGLSSASGSESYFADGLPAPRPNLQRRRPGNRAKSPLSLGSLASSPMNTGGLMQESEEWDYAETERWGWIILLITWFVFVMGMGSVTGAWGWVWDVGADASYPRWLEVWDDPTLPIEGYYPCLLLLTSVMVWVWVVVSWMGMKYFRHAKINGDH